MITVISHCLLFIGCWMKNKNKYLFISCLQLNDVRDYIYTRGCIIGFGEWLGKYNDFIIISCLSVIIMQVSFPNFLWYYLIELFLEFLIFVNIPGYTFRQKIFSWTNIYRLNYVTMIQKCMAIVIALTFLFNNNHWDQSLFILIILQK